MMKIGIITFQRADNYGAILQCFALSKAIEKNNKDVEVIDYRNKIIENRYTLFPRFRKNIIMWLFEIYEFLINFKKLKKRKMKFQDIRDKINFSKSYKKNELLSMYLPYDLIISGSDQVLNPDITKCFDEVYYLNLKGKFRKATYAASFGSIELESFKNKEIIEKIKHLDFLALRETDAYEFFLKNGVKNTNLTLDPTFLLDRGEWEDIVNDTVIGVEDDYVLLYFVQENNEIIELAKVIAKEKNQKVVCFNKQIARKNKWIDSSDAGPLEFVKLIKNANFVVTSSFHATVFSSIFEKEIFIITHSVTGSRVSTLAKIFGFENRIYSDCAAYKACANDNSTIIYKKEVFYDMKINSLDYLAKITSEEV